MCDSAAPLVFGFCRSTDPIILCQCRSLPRGYMSTSVRGTEKYRARLRVCAGVDASRLAFRRFGGEYKTIPNVVYLYSSFRRGAVVYV